MITFDDIFETNRMITENKLDVRTITMGISLRDCAHPNITKFCQNIYDKITKSAEFLVKTGEDIEAEFGIPIIHKRISVTPIAIAADACETDTYVPVAEALDKAGKARMQPFSVLLLECPYPMFERIKLLIEGHEGRIESSDYGAAVTLTFLLPVQKTADFSAALTELSGGQMSAEEVEQRFLPGARE